MMEFPTRPYERWCSFFRMLALGLLAVLLLVASNATATDDPFGITVDGIVHYENADSATGTVVSVVIPKAFVPNIGYTEIYFDRETEIYLDNEDAAFNVEFTNEAVVKMFDLFFLMPTEFYWSFGLGIGTATFRYINAKATSPFSDTRFPEFESDIEGEESVSRARQAFSRIAVNTGMFYGLIGFHRVEYDSVLVNADDLDDEIEPFNSNFATLGIGVSW